MKTLLSLGFAGWSAVALSGCGSSDDAGLSAPDAAASTSGAAAPEGAAPDANEAADAEPAGALPPNQPTPGDDMPDPAARALTDDVPAPAREELSWRPCGQFENRDLECAELEVPIDYADAEGETLSIALRRIRANPLEPHRGSLLFNPGGPGGAGIDTAIAFFEGGLFDQIAPGFDIIGFDPRGVAQSGERGCGIEPGNLYPDPTTNEAQDGLESAVNEIRALGEDCEQEWGLLFRKLGSNQVVRDMEAIREALGEPVLNFYGASYGTRLGALYAHEYPATTGRIVLDAPVHPRASYIEMLRGQLDEAIFLTETIFGACEAAAIECPEEVRQVFDQLLANATARGIEVPVIARWVGQLASEAGLQDLLGALAAEAADPGGDWIESFAASDGGGAGLVPFASVSCTDDPYEPPTLAQIDGIAAEFAQADPVFAIPYSGYATLCSGWPTTRDPAPLPTARNAPPLLVIGGTADSRTPYPWAQAMTETLGNATLLTSNHFGHGALTSRNACVLGHIRAYLTSGSMPATGATCS